jgi:hypothetical protein
MRWGSLRNRHWHTMISTYTGSPKLLVARAERCTRLCWLPCTPSQHRTMRSCIASSAVIGDWPSCHISSTSSFGEKQNSRRDWRSFDRGRGLNWTRLGKSIISVVLHPLPSCPRSPGVQDQAPVPAFCRPRGPSPSFKISTGRTRLGGSIDLLRPDTMQYASQVCERQASGTNLSKAEAQAWSSCVVVSTPALQRNEPARIYAGQRLDWSEVLDWLEYTGVYK